MKYNFNVGLLVAFIVLLSPNFVSASTVYISGDTDSVKVGDTASVEVRLNTEDEQINVVEGEIRIEPGSNNVEVREISVSGSSLVFWSRKPSLSADNKIISFVGGVPGGVNQKDALLFKIYFKATRIGSLNFAVQNVKSYINDGKGTLAKQTNRALSLSITKAKGEASDEWRKVVSSDNMPPEFLAATIGNDSSMYENRLYLVINATDYQSGIDRLEVKEGDLPFIRSGNTYVLRDQNQKTEITINAYDKAGNVRTLVIKPSFWSKYLTLVVGLAVVSIIALSVVIILILKSKSRKIHGENAS